MDVEKLRASIIKFHGLRNVDCAYTFYYDETNNIRKFYLAEDGFNVPDPGNFVLAGVAYKGHQRSENFDVLAKNIGLQKTANELKFHHVASGDFEAIIGSKKLGILLQWILDGDLNIHYMNLNVIYWALVDIVDSVLPETSPELAPIHIQLKGDLYRVVMNDRLGFVCNAHGFGFPNILPESVPAFSAWLRQFVQENSHILDRSRAYFLNRLIENMRDASELPMLGGEGKGVLVGSFSAFFFKGLYLYKNSTHIFDAENKIEGEFSRLGFTVAGKPLENYRFADSKSEPLIQVSDVIAGLLGKYFTFVRSSSIESLATLRKAMSHRKLQNMALLRALIDRSHNESNGFFNTVGVCQFNRVTGSRS